MEWTARDNFHSRLVFWLKILLPFTALAILSTLFMVSRNVSPENAIPYADVDVADRAKQPRLTSAVFAAMTRDGAALTLKAGEARPGMSGSGNAGSASDLSGVLETPDGAQTNLTAATARLDQAARVMILSGGVVVTNSLGYRIEMPGATVALDQTRLDSNGPVLATGPAGRLSADEAHLGTTGPGAGYLLVFKGRVRLLYQPTE